MCLDDVMLELKITPDMMEISIPRYFVEERAKELEERDKLLAALLQQVCNRAFSLDHLRKAETH